MKYTSRMILPLLIAAVLLCGCGAPAAPEAPAAPVKPMAPPMPGDTVPEGPAAKPLPEGTYVPFIPEMPSEPVEAPTPPVPAEYAGMALHQGYGYQIYIPTEGWRMESETDDGIPQDKWTSVDCEDAELSIWRYDGIKAEDAIARFAADGDYVYQDLLGGGSAEDCLIGYDSEDKEYCKFFCVQTGAASYVVAWESLTALDFDFGAMMTIMAGSFQVTPLPPTEPGTIPTTEVTMGPT